ncbi:hypothetical protein [Pseudoalteromonas sp. Of7M-16]|uniref:hypothetical protein n=1 Tax=Pseudoalteromonas sp. Of7M-16 TaxID=2917756 RepID=UPI001EF5B3D5|nr:hypothetical protein [Pseudoalteromonas sp. Of7M-16]MCG7547762.1 hypothetical protein [Pseudoalteromonas sp. Of7M-16]
MKLLAKIAFAVLLCGSANASAAEFVTTFTFGPYKSTTTTAVIAQWRKLANSTNSPSVRCFQMDIGPGWKCYASGYA